MSGSASDEEIVDRVVEQLLRGESVDVERVIADAPNLEPDTREHLRKMARAFGDGAPDEHVMLARDSELPFETLGPYTLLARMGEGGMGMVYLAEHRFLARRVALKIIRPELAASNVARQRFQREAMRIASLRHENIVSVYDAGEHDGVAFLSMELVEGAGLDELLRAARDKGERIDVASAVRHARDVARALQCAHDAGIIHRDVKPSNVRVTPDGRAQLLDFGLSLGEDAPSVSSAGQFRGTPQYASPEQIEPSLGEIDARTDVYSLGISLYECLTGEAPFQGSSTLHLFQQILTRTPREPRDLDERVDGVLNDIVMRAIAKRREQRFESARELERALDAWLENAGRMATTERRAHSRIDRAFAAIVVIVLAIAAAFVLYDRGTGSEAALSARPVAAFDARTTTALLGAADREFDQRMSEWESLGRGTFGADYEGFGVIGMCKDGIACATRALSSTNGRARARVEPLANERGVRALGAGAGVEFSNGRIVALLLASSADSYALRVCELVRDGAGNLIRGPDLHFRERAIADGQSLELRVSWNGEDTQLDWGDAAASERAGPFLVPRTLRDGARVSRLLLIVEQGSGRFDDLALEEP